jgi:hypothetical protein
MDLRYRSSAQTTTKPVMHSEQPRVKPLELHRAQNPTGSAQLLKFEREGEYTGTPTFRRKTLAVGIGRQFLKKSATTTKPKQ